MRRRPISSSLLDSSRVLVQSPSPATGVVQRIADRGGPLDPEDLASMRATDLDELNVAAPERIGGPVWVYFLNDKGGFRADWVLVGVGDPTPGLGSDQPGPTSSMWVETPSTTSRDGGRASVA